LTSASGQPRSPRGIYSAAGADGLRPVQPPQAFQRRPEPSRDRCRASRRNRRGGWRCGPRSEPRYSDLDKLDLWMEGLGLWGDLGRSPRMAPYRRSTPSAWGEASPYCKAFKPGGRAFHGC
jgi:hypothetical protein